MAKVNITDTDRYLSINGKEYLIAKRTGKLEKRIREEYADVKLGLSEFDRYMKICELLLGEDACAELFPFGEDESLDKMAQIAFYAEKEFNHGRDKIINEQFKEIDDMTKRIRDFNKAANDTIDVSKKIK